MNIVGLPSIHHPAWAVIRDGKIVVSIEEDRLHRQKNRFGIVNRAGEIEVLRGWEYCLRAAGISAKDIDYLALGFNPSSVCQPDQVNYRHETRLHERVFGQQNLLLNHLRRIENCDAPAIYLRHHLAHAAGVYFCSPFDEAAIVIADGWGEDETASVFKAEANVIRHLASVTLPNSLGEIYTQLTCALGWGKDDAGKTMGLAAYGSRAQHAEKLIQHGNPFEEKLWFDTSKAAKLIGEAGIRSAQGEITQRHADLAGRIQTELEDAMLYITKWALTRTGSSKLCLGGGVALNSVSNYRILTESGFERVYIQPACGDSGIPVGSSLGVYFHSKPSAERITLTTPFLGIDYSVTRVREAIGELPLQFIENPDQLISITVDLLVDQKIIGWYQGKSEYGPRSLGHRSILTDPRRPEMKDILNRCVKHREPFRPFAPSVLEEKAQAYFGLDVASPFMLFVSPILASRLTEIPAVAHIDGTARLHTVAREIDPLFHRLINRFAAVTGVPVLLNTSFNVAGEPMVETPEDAIRCFLQTDIDYLVIGQFLVSKMSASPSHL